MARKPYHAKVSRRRVPGEMNRLEAAYAAFLEIARREDRILDWQFEPVTLRLAKRTSYTPDFMVVGTDERIEFHETKGFMRDDANVKLKVAAATFPFVFKLVTRKGGTWTISEVPV